MGRIGVGLIGLCVLALIIAGLALGWHPWLSPSSVGMPGVAHPVASSLPAPGVVLPLWSLYVMAGVILFVALVMLRCGHTAGSISPHHRKNRRRQVL